MDKSGRDLILNKLSRDWSDKFDKGVEEHGPGFMDIPTLDNAWEEVLDQASYVAKALHDRDKTIFYLETALHAKDWGLVQSAYNIVKYGNQEGFWKKSNG